MRSLHTDVPLGSERSSGSAVRFPVITTLFMLVAATAQFLSACSVRPASQAARAVSIIESRAVPGRNSLRSGRSTRLLRGSPCPRGGAEHLVPVRGADPEAPRVVLEVVAHAPFAHHPAQAAVGQDVMQVVVHHAVDEVPAEEAAAP